jgi:hypothetical protein
MSLSSVPARRATLRTGLVASFAFAGALGFGASACNGLVDPDTQVAGVSERLGIGDPCTPEVEKTPGFSGFSESQVAVEDQSRSCASRTCLVNHFRGKTTCPNGGSCHADATDASPGASGSGETQSESIPAQCTDRRTEDAVYCSCRCANAEGRTDDGEAYCACPDAFACERLVEPVPGEERLAGSYCIKRGTKYDPARSCSSTCEIDGTCAQPGSPLVIPTGR